jgi:putative SOS response-associated peptidase YedK
MCGRYALHHNPDVIALQFGVGMLPQFNALYNIAPSTNILIVREEAEDRRTADLYRWGLIPGWAKDPSIGNKLANARGETVAEKPSFRSACASSFSRIARYSLALRPAHSRCHRIS